MHLLSCDICYIYTILHVSCCWFELDYCCGGDSALPMLNLLLHRHRHLHLLLLILLLPHQILDLPRITHSLPLLHPLLQPLFLHHPLHLSFLSTHLHQLSPFPPFQDLHASFSPKWPAHFHMDLSHADLFSSLRSL